MLLSFVCVTCVVWGQNAKLIKKAQNGDAKAQYELGRSFERGINGFEKNESESAKWYLKAAEQGHVKAQYEIAVCYNLGFGVTEDKDEAEYWYRKSAAQGYDPAYFALGRFYEDTNKQEAIYWFKKDMDAWYKKYGEEYENSSEHLRKLGVYYHPADKSSTSTASSSSSSSSSSKSSYSSSSSSSSSSSKTLLYKGTYTKSAQGYCQETGQYTDAFGSGGTMHVEIYDSYILVNNIRYDYSKTSGNWRIYKGYNNWGSTPYYKVNQGNYEMSYYVVTQNPYSGGYNTFVYEIEKGEVSFDIHQNNTTTYGGGSSSGGSGSYGNRSSRTTNSSTGHTCSLCHGKKRIVKNTYPSLMGTKDYKVKCNVCGGYFMRSTGHTHVICPNCHGRGYIK